MADDPVTCPLCGLLFEASDTLCGHGCPLRATCGLVRCPGCEYEFPRSLRPLSWWQRLRGRAPRPDPCQGLLAVSDLQRGESAVVAALPASAERCNALAVFGLVPDAAVTLVQRRPACVLRVGETELALDRDIACQILVRRPAEIAEMR